MRAPTPSLFSSRNERASGTTCSWKLLGRWRSGALIFLSSIDGSLLEGKKRASRGLFLKKRKKKRVTTHDILSRGEIVKKRPPVGVEEFVNVALSGGAFSGDLALALGVQFKLSPLVLAGFSALGPEPQQIGAYLPIHTRPCKLINTLISNTIHGRPLTKGFQPLEEGRERNCEEIIFSFRSLIWCESFSRPS